MIAFRLITALLILIVSATVSAQNQQKRMLELEDTVAWRTISGWRLSPNGSYIAWTEKTDDGKKSTLHVSSTNTGSTVYQFPGAATPSFGPDNDYAVTWFHPTDEAKEKAKTEKKDAPKKYVGIITLKTGKIEKIEGVKQFALPSEDRDYLGLLMNEKSKPTELQKKSEQKKVLRKTRKEKKKAKSRKKEKSDPSAKQEKGEKKEPKPPVRGHKFILRRLGSKKSKTFDDVVSFHFSRDGKTLALFSGGDGDLLMVDPRSGKSKVAAAKIGSVKSPKFDRSGKRMVMLVKAPSDADKKEKVDENYEVMVYQKGRGTDRFGTPGVEPIAVNWEVSTDRAPRFSRDGKRVLFGIRETPASTKDQKKEEKKIAKLDIWSWQDDHIQPRQLSRRNSEKKRSRLVIAHLSSTRPRLIELESERLRSVRLAFGDLGDIAVATDDTAYRRQASYDTNHPKDVWLINVKTGERERILTEVRGRFSLSPSGRWLYWWDGKKKTWFGRPTAGGATVDLGIAITEPLDSPHHDTPSLPRPRSRGLNWTGGDRQVILAGRYDLYLVTPENPQEVVSLTSDVGRSGKIRFTLIDQDPKHTAVKTSVQLLLSAFHENSRDGGFWRADPTGKKGCEPLLRGKSRYGRPVFSENGRKVALTVETFNAPPDIHVTTKTFGRLTRVSNLAEQTKPFKWGSVQLVNYTSARGDALNGLLYLPEDFDPSKRYPMLVNFYERSSDRLHGFQTPSPHRSSVRMSFYTSRGWVGFIPDVAYQVGSPGQSAVDCVLPGIESIVKQGFVDPERIGMQGHSWGGYQAAFLITKTNKFAAVIAGAPVANMTSAYGGIRWGSGMSRQFQYEKTQSRLGTTLWDDREMYIANSPLFFLETVETPLLILHNDKDGAVPWYQGIELFMGLRRLNKPVWLLNYNGQPHHVTTPATRLDYARRMQQFLAHHCKKAPAAHWMTRGVPAVKKGEDLGLRLESNDR